MLIIFAWTPSAFALKQTMKEELIYRVTLGKPEDVQFLVEKIGNPNITDELGYPLLYIAASRTDDIAPDVVKVLVEEGADVNYHGGYNNHPIMGAVQSGNPKTVRYLLDQGADYQAVDVYGISVLDFARQSGNKDISKMIERMVMRDRSKNAALRTQASLNQLTYDLAYHACASQYYSYYYKSGQDKIPLSTQNETLAKHKQKVTDSYSKLVGVFRIKRDELDKIFSTARHRMHREMEQMVSNRWRRKQGVGQSGDMDKRCKAHVEEFKDGVFDKANLDRR